MFDLARVLRVAGTVNWKDKANPKPVEILERSPIRWSVDDIDAMCVAEQFVGGEGEAFDRVGPLRLDPRRQPDIERFGVLLNNSDAAKAAFENTAKISDTSPSGFDMSLASTAARCGWTDQEIADLLVYHRVKRGHDLKTTSGGVIRQDYYQRTIARARAGVDQEVAIGELEEGVGDIPFAGEEVTDTKRAEILHRTAKVFGLPEIEEIVRYGEGREAMNEIVLRNGSRIEIGSTAKMISQLHTSTVMFMSTGRLMANIKPKVWRALMEGVALVTRHVRIEESTPEVRIEEKTILYANRRLHAGDSGWAACVPSGRPFIRDGCVWINSEDLWRHLQGAGEDVPHSAVWRFLDHRGFRGEKVAVTSENGRRSVRRYWAAPLDSLGAEWAAIAKDVSKRETRPEQAGDR